MKINKRRLFQRILEMGRIGKEEQGGITRLSYTEEEKAAKALLTSYMLEAGLTVREDSVGNLIGRKEGKEPNAPAVVTGSHFDTVPKGGIFDGVLGVIAGIEVLQSMKENEIETAHPIEVTAFIDEEGARFGIGMIGSRAVAGKLKEQHLQFTDSRGVTLADAMRQLGLDPDALAGSARNPETVKAYIELHIEQGKVLENQNIPVGIVSGIAGPLWLDFRLSGEAGHAGATPMGMRRDPMAAAAGIISFIYEETRKYPGAVATVGKISVLPGGINVIPAEAEFTVDLRDIDEVVRDKIEESITAYALKVCKESNIELVLNTLQRVPPAICSEEVYRQVEKACKKSGIKPFTLISGAGHDSMQFKDFCPAGMIFVRSKGGISHSPDEWSSEDDCGMGAEVLYHSIMGLDGQV